MQHTATNQQLPSRPVDNLSISQGNDNGGNRGVDREIGRFESKVYKQKITVSIRCALAGQSVGVNTQHVFHLSSSPYTFYIQSVILRESFSMTQPRMCGLLVTFNVTSNTVYSHALTYMVWLPRLGFMQHF